MSVQWILSRSENQIKSVGIVVWGIIIITVNQFRIISGELHAQILPKIPKVCVWFCIHNFWSYLIWWGLLFSKKSEETGLLKSSFCQFFGLFWVFLFQNMVFYSYHPHWSQWKKIEISFIAYFFELTHLHSRNAIKIFAQKIID